MVLEDRPERLNRGLTELLFGDSFNERGDVSGGGSFAPSEGFGELLPGHLVEPIDLFPVSGLRRRTGS
jgi:hypothetical protein